MNLFQLVDLAKMGDFDEKWGVAYWGKTDEGKAVKFNSMNQNITAPCKIMAEETTAKTSAKGTAYLQLKKVKVAEKAPETATEQSIAPSDSQLDRIEEKLDKILAQFPITAQEDNIRLGDIPF